MDDRHERCFICDDPTHRSGEDSIYIGVSGIGPWCDSCYADMVQEVEGDARAEERAVCNAANAATDPALLALARFGAEVLCESTDYCGSFACGLSMAALEHIALAGPVLDFPDVGSPTIRPGIASAIARLLAPDGTESEVAP